MSLPASRRQWRVCLIREVAEALGVHRSTVWRWIDSGALPAFRRGRSVRILRENLEAFLVKAPSSLALRRIERKGREAIRQIERVKEARR